MHAAHPRLVCGEPDRWHPVLLLLLALLVPAGARSQSVDAPLIVEVFTSSEQAAVVPADAESHRVGVAVYCLDGLHQLETSLSAQLPNDAAAAQRVALQRIGELDHGERETLRSGAVGLAKALQYGLDRYPAIVINGAAVVYGTTDVELGLSRYQSWREERVR